MIRLLRIPRRKSRRRAGYSLIDVLVGFVIMSYALGSAFELSIHNARMVERNQQLSAAALLARHKIEDLRNLDYVDIVTGEDEDTLSSLGDPEGIFTRSWEVSTNTPTVGCKTIVVTITWDQWGEERTYRMRGVISDE